MDMQATKRCSESKEQSQELFGLPAFGPSVSALETLLATGNIDATVLQKVLQDFKEERLKKKKKDPDFKIRLCLTIPRFYLLH